MDFKTSAMITFLFLLRIAAAADLSSLSASGRHLFDAALSYADGIYDERAGYLFSTDAGTPGQYDTRSSAMYATGLLLRNGRDGDDVQRAIRIIHLVAQSQYGLESQSTPWFGTYPHAPDEPTPGIGGIYGTLIYSNYDPNWRDFIGTAWCLALATSEDLLPSDTIRIIEQSLLYAAEGNLYRYQGRGEYANSVNVNASADNLDEAYTNPWLMGVFLMGFIGDRLNNTLLKDQSDTDAQKIYDLFTYHGFNTFSEYNSPTYTGVDLYALALWITHAPKGSKMRRLGGFMLKHTLEDIGTLYHSDLRNLAGPWDRTYGFDMTRYQSILGQYITALVPLGQPAIPLTVSGSLHMNDYPCFAALNAFLSPSIAAASPSWVLENLSGFKGERSFMRYVRTNTEDPHAVRNVTAWLGERVAIGGQSLDEPFVRQSSMVSGIIQWKLSATPTNENNYSNTDAPQVPRIGYIVINPPTASTISVVADRNTLTIRFPPSSRWKNVTLPHSVVFCVGGFDARTFGVNMTRGLEDVGVQVRTAGMGPFEISYNGGGNFNGFYSYQVTYPVIPSWNTIPEIVVTVDSEELI